MVYKMKVIRLIIFTIIFILLFFTAILIPKKTETNLLKTLLPESIIETENIVPIANKTSSVVKIVF